MQSEIISRVNVNHGFDFEEAIMEAIDDAFEAAGKPTAVNCWIFKESNNYSYIVADSAGGTDLEDVFTIREQKKYSNRFAKVDEIYERTGMFGAGSFSHLNVSNKVYFITKNKDDWDVVMLEKVLETGDFEKRYITVEQIDSSSMEKIQSLLNIEQYDSILFVTGVNLTTNQTVKDFKEKQYFYGLEKNLRSTYAEMISKGYNIYLNGKKIKPLDVLYLDCINSGGIELFDMEITLQELLHMNSYHKGSIFKIYLEIFDRTYHDEAENRLLQEKICVRFFAYDTKYFNKIYFEKIKPDDSVIFNQQTSGAWIFRNGRKIGNPKLLSFMNSIHPSWNGLRVKIEFSPIFDAFFGIQINKNRFVISDEVLHLIEVKMKQKYGKFAGNEIKEVIRNHKYITSSQEQLTMEMDGEDNFDKGIDELWERAEELGMRELRRQGYNVTDVRNKKKGYDFIASHTTTGETRYVEVKRIKKVGESFNLTPQEYKSSLSLKEKYFVFLVLIKEKEVCFIWINNPRENISFDEVLKIESYKSTGYNSDSEYSVKINDLL